LHYWDDDEGDVFVDEELQKKLICDVESCIPAQGLPEFVQVAVLQFRLRKELDIAQNRAIRQWTCAH
jgi:hypothetical protein